MKHYCKVFRCEYHGDKICCAYCRDLWSCADRCLNHPSRCKLEDKKRRIDHGQPQENR